MKAKIATLLSTLSLLVFFQAAALPARADVIYTWHTASSSPSLLQFESQIVISDAAFARGSADLDFSCYSGPCAEGDNNGILSITYAFNGEYLRSIMPGSAVPMADVEVDSIHFDFSDPAGFLAGSLFTLSTFEQYVASSQARLWRLARGHVLLKSR